MNAAFHALRSHATAAHVGPLVVFMMLGLVPDAFRIENSALPWYRQQPEHWWYPVQTVVCVGLLWWWRGQYEWSDCRRRHLGLAAVAAVVGIGAWVLPGWFYQQAKMSGGGVEEWWRWLGVVDRKQGFDLSLLADEPVLQRVSLAARFLRMTLVVPLVEELCWRGWLMRRVVAGDRPFTRIPFGTHTWKAYAITTLAVTLVHAPEDWLAAWVWGSLVYALAVRTRSLRACVMMHALGNLLLGLYVLKTGQNGYW